MVKRTVTKDILKIVFWGVVVLFALILTSFYNYLLFHSIAEIFSVIIACGIFIVAWNSRRIVDNSYLLFLGIVYLFVALMDLIHTLSYKGMGVFPEYGANLATQLWIAARYMESVSLMIAPFFINRKMEIRFVFISFTAFISLLLGSIFYWNIFPDCFVEGTGLTPFKKISEYIISAILAISIFLLFRKQKEFDDKVFRLLVASFSITILSELAFTFYVHAYSVSNLTGHFLKIISFYLIYEAIIANSLMEPYNLLFRNLKQSEENLLKFKFISDNSNDAHFLIDRDRKIQYVNSSACKMLGYSEKELLMMESTDVDTVHDKAMYNKVFDLIQEERLSNIETVNRRKDGTLFPSRMTVTGYQINGKSYMFAALRDISGRKQIEKILKEREERYRRLFEDSPISLWEEDYSGVKAYIDDLRDSGIEDFSEYFINHSETLAYCATKVKVIDINKATMELFKADDKQEFIGGIGNVFTKETYSVFKALLVDMTKGKNRFESETTVRTLSGEEKYVNVRLSVAPGYEATWSKVLVSIIDITERKQAEEKQLRLKQRLEAQWEIARMVDTDEKTLSDLVLDELVSMTGSKYGFYGFCNKDESIMTSYSWTKEVMRDCKIYKKPVEFPIEKSGVWGNAVRYRKTIIINNYRNKNHPNKKGLPEGHVPINRILVVPIFRHDRIVAVGAVADKAGYYTDKDAEQMNAFLHSAQIIQDKRQAEEELRKHREQLMELVEERTHELQKMNEELEQEIAERKQAEAEALRASQLASLGELAAGVAHEINNPINGIINYTQILVNKSKPGSKELDIAKRIIKESDRIADIVRGLLSFARDNKDKKYPVRIHEIISESLALTEAQIKKDGIRLRVNILSDMPKIVAQPQQIEQVFLNIISNARYALNQKYPEAHDNKVLEIKADKAIINNAPHIRITFYDKGIGIPDEIKDKIINPFFSTKSSAQGTGLGLSISHGIISAHRGQISIESVKGEFTKIIIDLPAEKKM